MTASILRLHFKTTSFLITLFLLSQLLRSLSAQPTSPSNAEQQAYLRKFIQQSLDTKKSVDDSTRFLSASTDLNDDGQPETIVYLIGNGWCGSGGCSAYILGNETGSFKVITRITITHLPIRLLLLRRTGGMILPSQSQAEVFSKLMRQSSRTTVKNMQAIRAFRPQSPFMRIHRVQR
jgi:hypothetical protein